MNYRTASFIRLDNSQAMASLLGDHLRQHGLSVSGVPGAVEIASTFARACLAHGRDGLDITIEAQQLDALQEMKAALAGHIVEFSPATARPDMTWSADGAKPSLPADFRELTLASVEPLGPHMRRLVFSAPNLQRFDRLDALHVRLFLPRSDQARTVWPMIGADGLPVALAEHLRPAVRRYTIRALDVARGRVTIDFVCHGDTGPGSRFACNARPGDRIGMAGPGGGGLEKADHYLFFGDETAWPAIARMAENLPPSARGSVFIDVHRREAGYAINSAAALDVHWLCRGDREASQSTLLMEAAGAMSLPADGQTYVWVGAEYNSFRAIRKIIKQKAAAQEGIEHLIVSYWRSGETSR